MKKVIIISLITILPFILAGCGNKKEEIKIVSEKTDKYIAYVKINPSVKLDYSRKCTEYSNKSIECDEPLVDEYELINDDAKEIFKDINFLESYKKLYSVITNICTSAKEKGIDVKDVEIKSDWDGINQYLEEKSKETKTNNETNNNQQNTKDENNQTEQNIVEENNNFNYNVNVVEEEQITNDITTEKEEEEARKKAEEEAKKKAEEEAKKKAEEEAKKKAAVTIKLKDNVTFCHEMRTYTCDNCFSNSLINTIKKAKGYSVTKSSSSEITYKRITKLTGSYGNNSNYIGSNVTNKITAAGGVEAGGAGGCDDSLTKAICNEYHLTCE